MLRFLLLLALLFLPFFPQTAEAYTLAGECTSPYGWRIHPIYGYPQGHAGIDVGVDMDTVVPSATSGTVTDYWGNQDPGGYGIVVAVEADDGSGTMLYAHLDDVLVEPGQHVSAGDGIALSGNSGGSTGPHLHIGYAPVGLDFSNWDDPMIVLSRSGVYNIGGDTNANTISGVVGKYVQKITPQIDVDFSTYFSPSETMENTVRQMLERIAPAFDLAQNYLMPFLAALAAIDLFILFVNVYFARSGSFNMMDILLRFLRYAFFITLFAGWREIVDEVFIPMLEGISTAASGTAFSESTFLHFDTIFVAVAHLISPFLHVDMRFGLVGAALVSVLVMVSLAFTLILTFYMMFKLVIFYIMCVFGVLGIPGLLFDKTRRYGASLISSIFCTIFDLVLTSFLYTFVADELTAQPVLEESISSLLLFTAGWGFLVFMFSKVSNDTMQVFSSLWDGWVNRPLKD